VNGGLFRTGCSRPLTGMTAAAVAVLATLAGCAPSESESSSAATAGGDLALSHVHGTGFDPADGRLLVATHHGLFVVDEDGSSERIGPVIDLMGFTVAGPDRLLASGHPGPDVDLPQPVGLIESTDGGRTWDPVSRQGESDFHALTVGGAGILGYDGALRRSTDGEDWQDLRIPVQPAVLSASPAGTEVLATTSQGLLRSADGGSTWSQVGGTPLLQTVAWGEDGTTVVGFEPSGEVWTSGDGGVTWQEGPDVGAPVQAAAVGADADGAARVAVVTTEGVLVSDDGGQTFDVVVGF
jgi:hypothetical protein